MGVVCPGAADHVPGPLLVDLDLPVVAQQRSDIPRAHVVGRVEPVRSGLLRIDVRMVHHEQDSPGCDGGEERALGVVTWCSTQRRYRDNPGTSEGDSR